MEKLFEQVLNPFIPGDSKNSGLPLAGLEFRFKNPTSETIEATYSFNAKNFMASGGEGGDSVRKTENGFVLAQSGNAEHPEREGYFSAQVVDDASVNANWFRGGWFDSLTMAWKDVESGDCVDKPECPDDSPSPGASLFVPISIPTGGERVVRLMFTRTPSYGGMETRTCPCSTAMGLDVSKSVVFESLEMFKSPINPIPPETRLAELFCTAEIMSPLWCLQNSYPPMRKMANLFNAVESNARAPLLWILSER